MEDRKNKLSLEELVKIGDWLHNTDCCFLIINKSEVIEKKNRYDTLGCILGNSKLLSDMLYATMLKDKNFYHLVTQTVLRIAQDDLEELTKNQ